MQGNNRQYLDSHRHVLKGLLSLITLSQKVKNLFDYQTLCVNGFPLKLKQIRLQPSNSKTCKQLDLSV